MLFFFVQNDIDPTDFFVICLFLQQLSAETSARKALWIMHPF